MLRKKHQLKTERAPKGMRRFLVVFLILVAAYYVITLIPWVDRNFVYPVLELSARGSSLLINLVGERTTTDGIRIQGSSFAVTVRRGCDPLEPIVLLGSAIIAFPASWTRRVLGLMVGGSLLFLINLVRISSLYWLGSGKSHLFETAHLELWPALFILLSLSLWVLWLLWVRNTTPAEHA